MKYILLFVFALNCHCQLEEEELMRRYRVGQDIMDDVGGPYNLADDGYQGREADGWPEGMDRHTNVRHANRKRLLDNGNAGQTVVTPPGVGTTVLRNLPIFEAAGDEIHPDEITIIASIQDPSPFARDPQFVINLEWGVQNFIASAQFDLIQGMMFSVKASTLKLTLSSTSPNEVGGIRVGVTASYGVRASHAPPQRTLEGAGAALAPGATGLQVEVPPFARGVYALVVSNAANGADVDYILRQENGFSSLISTHPYVVGGVMSPLRIPLQNDTQFLRIRNESAANNINSAHYIFDLAF